MSCRSFRHVLALLPDNEQDLCAVLERAVELAEAEHARLTLAKTSDPGTLMRWLSPLVPLSRVAPLPDPDCKRMACRLLTRAAQAVPQTVPVSTMVLGSDTPKAVRELAATGTYDLLVLAAPQLKHAPKLRRELRRLGLCMLAVTRDEAVQAGSGSVAAVAT